MSHVGRRWRGLLRLDGREVRRHGLVRRCATPDRHRRAGFVHRRRASGSRRSLCPRDQRGCWLCHRRTGLAIRVLRGPCSGRERVEPPVALEVSPQRERQITSVGEPSRGVLLEAAHDDLRELVRHRRWRDRRGILRRDRQEQRHLIVPRERHEPREELVEHHAERPHVASRVGVPQSLDGLGGHVERRSHRHVRGRQPLVGVVADPRDAKVEHLRDDPLLDLREKHVFGLEVAVDDPRAMRSRDRVDDRQQDRQRCARRDSSAEVLEVRRQVLPLQELLHDEGRAVSVLAHIEHVHHVGVAHLVGRPRLAQKPLHHLRLREQLGAQDLDRDDPADRPVLRAVHVAHAAGAETLVELVFSRQNLSLARGCHSRPLLSRQ
jgi:hypothetical protein